MIRSRAALLCRRIGNDELHHTHDVAGETPIAAFSGRPDRVRPMRRQSDLSIHQVAPPHRFLPAADVGLHRPPDTDVDKWNRVFFTSGLARDRNMVTRMSLCLLCNLLRQRKYCVSGGSGVTGQELRGGRLFIAVCPRALILTTSYFSARLNSLLFLLFIHNKKRGPRAPLVLVEKRSRS